METAFCHLSTFNRPIFKKQYWYMQNLNQFEFFSKLNIIYTGNVHVLSSTKYQYLCMPVPNIDTNRQTRVIVQLSSKPRKQLIQSEGRELWVNDVYISTK